MIPIIIGANGITGTAQIELLLTLPNVSRIVGVSRKPPNAKWLDSLSSASRERLSWVSVDFLKEGGEKEAVGKLSENEDAKRATHFMYMAYIDGVENMNDANARIFERSLRAVETVASNSLSFVLLQIGLGVYGGLRSPMPWREDRCAGPNPRWNKAFYTPQMAFLKSFEKGKRWEGNWTITAPSLIFGATTGAYMNVSTTLGILACIKSVLGEPFQFPGAKGAYEAFQDGSDVALVAKFNVWAMSEPKCRGEMFNIVNGDLFNWENIWPILAEEFGAVVPKDQFRDVPAGVDWRKWKRNSVEQEMTRKYPTASSPTTKAEYAWNLLCQQDRTLDPDGWKYATWDFLDQTILYGSLASMNKAKKLGWTGFVDTEDMFRAQWQKMRELSIAPKVKIVPQAPGKSKI